MRFTGLAVRLIRFGSIMMHWANWVALRSWHDCDWGEWELEREKVMELYEADLVNGFEKHGGAEGFVVGGFAERWRGSEVWIERVWGIGMRMRIIG